MEIDYRTALHHANLALARDPDTVFIGYGITKSFALGTLRDVNTTQLIETTVAENLMVGLAIGMALRGRRPVVYIERMDFILNALDAIVNHLSALRTISRGEFSPGVIIRSVVGNKRKPIFTGETHTQDFTEALMHLVDFPVFQLHTTPCIESCYAEAARLQRNGTSSILVEYKDNI